MIGVFDSGEGGLITVEKIRRLSPNADIAFLADRENAPYGTKTREEIILCSKRNIKRLREVGAEKILIACCTASTVFPFLSPIEKELAIPIIEATARLAARKTKTKKIGVIATEATVSSGAFSKSIKTLIADAEVTERAAQELVGLVEGGESDSKLSKKALYKIKELLSDIRGADFDVLILGCTHFPRLEKTISEITGKLTVSSALAGALEIQKYIENNGKGLTLYL